MSTLKQGNSSQSPASSFKQGPASAAEVTADRARRQKTKPRVSGPTYLRWALPATFGCAGNFAQFAFTTDQLIHPGWLLLLLSLRAMGDKPLPSSFDDNPDFFEDNPWKKLGRRLKEEPLVPLGIGATCYALFRAYRSMKLGDSVQVNRMFRARIYAQAFTLLAVCAGSVYYKTERDQRKELEKAMDLKKQQAKRDAWLKELEIREQEDKDWQNRHATIENVAKGTEVKSPVVASTAEVFGQEKTEESETQEPSDTKGSSGGVLSAVKNLAWGSK